MRDFKHNDPISLNTVLSEIIKGDPSVRQGMKTVFVSIESIYSIDGDIAPAKEIVKCVKDSLPQRNMVFVIDEAHSNGIIGSQGRGLISSLGLEPEFAVRLHTFGKGINASGGSVYLEAFFHTAERCESLQPFPAAVLCPQLVKETIINYARGSLFTTEPTLLSLAAVRASYNIVTGCEGDQVRAYRSHFADILSNICCTTRGERDFRRELAICTNLLPNTTCGQMRAVRADSGTLGRLR